MFKNPIHNETTAHNGTILGSVHDLRFQFTGDYTNIRGNPDYAIHSMYQFNATSLAKLMHSQPVNVLRKIYDGIKVITEDGSLEDMNEKIFETLKRYGDTIYDDMRRNQKNSRFIGDQKFVFAGKYVGTESFQGTIFSATALSLLMHAHPDRILEIYCGTKIQSMDRLNNMDDETFEVLKRLTRTIETTRAANEKERAMNTKSV